MRPVRLTFAGLRSYRAETTIDFDSLDLFAVIGDTGAGKSTLIEALCLALYARKSWSGGDAGLSDMISDGMNTMRIELAFRAAGHDWTVTRARHRNSSSPIDKLVSPTGGLGADGAKAVTARVTELIGLTYDQFTRAVVLPQGRFDSLLRATEKQRNEILTSILDLGDVAATKARAESLRKQWEPRVIEWTTLRSQHPADPRAALDEATRRADDAARLDDALGAAVEQVATIEARTSAAADHRSALHVALDRLPPSPDLASLRSAAATWESLSAELGRVVAEEVAARTLLDELSAATVAVRRGASSRDELVASLSEVNAVAVDLPDARAALDAAIAALAAVGPTPPAVDPDPRLNTAVEAAASGVVEAEAARRAADEAVTSARHALVAWRSAAVGVTDAAAAVAGYDDRLATGATVVAASEAELAGATVALDAAQAGEHAALRADAAATAAAGCTPGDPCPVCDRSLPEEFAPPVPADDVEAARAARLAAAEAVAIAADQLARHRGQLDKLDGERTAAVATLEMARSSFADAGSRAAAAGLALDERDTPDSLDDTRALAGPVATASAAETTLNAARAAHADALAALERDRSTRAAAATAHAAELAAATDRRAEADRRLERLLTRLTSLPGEWGAVVSTSTDPAAVCSQLAAELSAAADELAALDDRRRTADDAVRDAALRTAELARRTDDEVHRPVGSALASARAYLSAVRSIVAASDADASADGSDARDLPDDLELVTDPPADRDDLLARVGRLEPMLAAAAAAVAAAGDRLAALDEGLADDERALAELVAAHGCTSSGELRERRGEARTGRAQSEAVRDATREAAAAAAVLDERLGVAVPFVANLIALEVALRSQHFVAHLVDARERELLAEASRRLKAITGGRFGFVADFGVVDVRSGEVRSPDTLSGGERFQAALALALALVEIASRGAGKLDAVFVDEGFGSLDHQALDVALATLGSVAGGGKMVALISHLRPVAEFVDDVLLVTKDELLGSRIELLDADAREEMLADDIRSGLTSA